MAETISTIYGTFNMIGSMGDCEGCHFDNPSGECKRPEDFGHSCTSPSDIIFQLLKLVAKEKYRCEGCWFYRNYNCDRDDWKGDSDFPENCANIIFVIDEEPKHDDPDWNDDDDDEITEVPFVKDDHPDKIYEGKRLIAPDGIHLKYVPEAKKSSCDECYFNRRDCDFHRIGIPDHDGWILVEDLPIKCGDGILAQIRKPGDVRLVLDMGITKSNPTPNMSFKKEKKFSI